MMLRLRKSRLANSLAERWYLHDHALGASMGRLKLYVDTQFSGTASLNENWQGSGKTSVEVSVTTLDDWCSTERVTSIGVVKMDVEGWEFAVLDGARHAMQTHRPYVWFEHNLPALKRSGLDPSRVLDILQEFGYEIFFDIARLPDCPPLIRSEVDQITNDRVNLLAVPAERSEDFSDRVIPLIRDLLGEGNA